MSEMKIALLGKTQSELVEIVNRLGMPKFTAGQIAQWLYSKKVGSIDEMTNLSFKNRERLKEDYEVGATAPVHAMRSVDGTVKYLFRRVGLYSRWRARYLVCLFSSGVQNELQVLYDRQARIFRQFDHSTNHQSDLFDSRAGYVDQYCIYGNG